VTIGDPKPPDPPLPPGPTPGAKWQVAFLVKSADLDNLPAAQRQTLASLKLREELKAQGHSFRGVYSQQQAATGEAAQWLAALATGEDLPRIALASRDGGPIKTYPLPADEAATKALIERGGQ
jgi:hypothetical protein